jgi:hypothetical protein
MVNLNFKTNAASATLALLASSSLMSVSEAAYGRYYYIDTPQYRPPTPPMSLGSKYLPILGTPTSLVSREAQRRAMLYEMDKLLDTMLGGGGGGGRPQSRGPRLGFEELMYDPYPFQRIMDSGWPLSSSHFLQGLPSSTLNALVPTATAFGITQDDDTQLQFVVRLPQGTTAHDVNLNLNEDTHVLSLSGETHREEGGISVHSRFDRSFSLHPRDNNIDTGKITAQLDTDGVLTIIAPKHSKQDIEGKENIRMIDIVEQQLSQQNVVAAGEDDTVSEDKGMEKQQQQEEKNSVPAQTTVDDSVIDLDVK